MNPSASALVPYEAMAVETAYFLATFLAAAFFAGFLAAFLGAAFLALGAAAFLGAVFLAAAFLGAAFCK